LRALSELREILGLLRSTDEAQPRTPTTGLDQLEPLLEAARGAGVRPELKIGGEPCPLPTAVDVAAYRIVQESITNVIRHAGPARVRVSIDYTPSELRLTVADDGAGLAPGQRFVDGSGLGLSGMRERAQALGGTLQAGRRPDGGFEVRGCLPLAEPLG